MLVGTAAAAAAAHTLLPDHWLPYVLTARARQMPHGRTIVMAVAGAITHLFSTVIIGLVFALAGESAAVRATWGLDRLIGLVVVGLGLYFLWRGWPGKGQRHEHREVGYSHMHDHLQEGLGHRHNCQEEEHTHTHGWGSDYTLGAILGVRPCVEAIPIFLAASTQGVFSSLAAIGAWVVVTVVSMVGIVWLSVRGLETLRFAWLEQYGELISGAVIPTLGVITLLL
ncbi:hypothetical protein [Neomoorella thermoacetica]|uniref:hypothetical protein n=1 Tax=Neomoorella thermoacetica TaxID=1525 RepID=UPI0008F9F1EF|nr:hypothetical protein [Moorella thermoacetica]